MTEQSNTNSIPANPQIYRTLIDNADATQDHLFDYSQHNYFKSGELITLKDPDTYTLETLYANMFQVMENIFSDVPKNLRESQQIQKAIYDMNLEINNVIQEKLMTGVVWDFNIQDKFLYIALLYCVRNCPELITFLASKLSDKKKIDERDNNGNTLIMHATFNVSSMEKLLQICTYESLFVSNALQITPIDMLIANGFLLTLLSTENTLKFSDVCKYNKNGMNVLHIACLFDSICIEGILNRKDFDQKLMLDSDLNRNNPLFMAFEIKNYKAIDFIIKSNNFVSAALECTNHLGRTIFSYHAPNFFETLFSAGKMEPEFVIKNNDNFVNYFTNTNFCCLNTFSESKYFKPEILYAKPEYSIFHLLCANINKLSALLNSNNMNTLETIKSTLKLNPKMFSKICTSGFDTAKQFIDKKLITRPMLLCSEFNCYNTIMSLLNEKAIDLLVSIVKSEYFVQEDLNYETQNISLLTVIIDYKFDLLEYLIEKKYISNKSHIEFFSKYTEKSLEGKNIEKLINLNLITKEVLNFNNYAALCACLRNPYVGNLILDNCELLDEDFFEIPQMANETYKCVNIEVFKKFIAHEYLKTNVINNFTIDVLGKLAEKLKILLELRNDFNRSKLYDKCLLDYSYQNNNKRLFQMMLEQKDLPRDNYYQITKKIFIDINETETYMKTGFLKSVIAHKYFEHDLIKLTINSKNILHILFEHKIFEVQEIFKSKHLTKEIFQEQDISKNNILTYALQNDFLVDTVINHKFMGKCMVLSTVKDLLRKTFNSATLNYLINNDLITKEELIAENKDTESYIFQLAKSYDREVVINLIQKYEDNTIILIQNKDGIMPLHYIVEITTFDDITNLGISVDDLIRHDNYGTTPLSIASECNKKLAQDIILNFDISRETMLETNNVREPILFLINMNYDVLNKVLDNKNMDDLMTITNTKKMSATNPYTFSKHLLQQNCELIPYYLKHKRGNTKFLFANGMEFLILVVTNYPNVLEEIVKLDILELKNPDIIHELVEASLGSEICIESSKVTKSFDVLTKSQYFNNYVTKTITTEKNLFSIAKMSQEYFEYLIKSSLIPHHLLFECDKFGDPYIIKMRYSLSKSNNNTSSMFKQIMASVSHEILTKINSNGQTILHLMATEDCFGDIVSSLSSKMINTKDIFGKTCIDYLIMYKNEFGLEKIFSHCLVKTNMLVHTDINGKLLMSKILKEYSENKIITDCLWENISSDQTILEAKDINGINNFGHIIINSKKLLENSLCCENISKALDNIDNEGRTCLMLAAQYNEENLIMLLKDANINSKHMLVSQKFGSCLTKAIKYTPKNVSHILNCKHMTEVILNSREEDIHNNTVASINIVQLACKYNPEALMFILASKFDLKHLVHETVGKTDNKLNSLKIAILYQPDAVEILLKSSYGSNKLIKETNELMETSCLIDSIHQQPASFQPLLKSGKMNPEDISYSGNPFYEIQKISYDYPQLDEKSNINNMIPLMKYKNEYCHPSDPRLCIICQTFKSKVIFDPCKHTCCVSCALKLEKCHMCRAEIEDKIVVSI